MTENVAADAAPRRSGIGIRTYAMAGIVAFGLHGCGLENAASGETDTAPSLQPPSTELVQVESTLPVVDDGPFSGPCADAELPPLAGNGRLAVIVRGVLEDDVRRGLQVQTAATGGVALTAVPNGTRMDALGPCEKEKKGEQVVWWYVGFEGSGRERFGWVPAASVTPDLPTPVCPAGNIAIDWDQHVDTILGDFDGDGATDSLYLFSDDDVRYRKPWNGSYATLQVQFADGGLSNAIDIASLVQDGGPVVGVFGSPWFPERIKPANTSRSLAVLSSQTSGVEADVGTVHLFGVTDCQVQLTFEVPFDEADGQRRQPLVCPLSGGREQFLVVENTAGAEGFTATPYDFRDGAFVPQPPEPVSWPDGDPSPNC